MTDKTSQIVTRLKRIWRWIRFPVVLYLGTCLLMMALESRLIYPRPSLSTPDLWLTGQPALTDVSFKADDGTKLHGWFFEHEQPQCAILYCHGNGEDLSSIATYIGFLRNKLEASVFAFDYRGYGKSTGSPNEKGLILDGLAAQKWLADRLEIEPYETVIMGRSLGGGVAVAIAEKQGAKALVLQNTFANLSEVAADKFFWLPVKWIMRNRYPSRERIKNYKGPLLQTHGTADRVVPYDSGRKLFEAAPGAIKQWVENVGMGHNEHLPPAYYETLADFLDAIPNLAPEE